jgi:hypothetical protein
MLLNVFSIYDSKSEMFSQPFFSPTPGAAMRAFSSEVNKEGSDFNRFPDDYTLHHLGTFDDALGFLVPLMDLQLSDDPQPVRIATARQVLVS